MSNIRELYQKTRDAAHWALYIVDDFRRCNLDSGIRLYRNFLSYMQWILKALLQNAKELEALGITMNPSCATELLKGLLHAQEQKDYILLADLIDMQVYPFLTELLNLIRPFSVSQDTSLYADYLQTNLKALEQKDAELAAMLQEHTALMERSLTGQSADGTETYKVKETDRIGEKETVYQIEATSIGYPTCRIEREGQQYYLHSNQDPYAEAGRWVMELVDEETKAYHILGSGLGYHGVRLYWALVGNYPVHIYESDLHMLWLCMKYCRMEDALSGKLFFHYDPKYKQLAEASGMEGHRLGIHYPSLRGISDTRIREKYEQFFIQDSSYRNAKLLLQGNFDANLSGLENEPDRIFLIDRLKDTFAGKTVFIVAAGPSLDKNVAMLKEVQEKKDCLILATGTVFRKLLGMDILPDYVILSEANGRVLAQIAGLEQTDVPMLMLSTANHGFMTKYRAAHYLIFQEGYPRAETAAALLETSLYQTGGSVSTTALDVSIRLGAARVVFLGLDLAFTDNLAHAQGTSNRVATDVEELMPVKAQNGGVVYADHKFVIYRKWIERRLLQEDSQKIEVINATEGGSYVEGMKHMLLAEVLKQL